MLVIFLIPLKIFATTKLWLLLQGQQSEASVLFSIMFPSELKVGTDTQVLFAQALDTECL